MVSDQPGRGVQLLALLGRLTPVQQRERAIPQRLGTGEQRQGRLFEVGAGDRADVGVQVLDCELADVRGLGPGQEPRRLVGRAHQHLLDSGRPGRHRNHGCWRTGAVCPRLGFPEPQLGIRGRAEFQPQGMPPGGIGPTDDATLEAGQRMGVQPACAANVPQAPVDPIDEFPAGQRLVRIRRGTKTFAGSMQGVLWLVPGHAHHLGPVTSQCSRGTTGRFPVCPGQPRSSLSAPLRPWPNLNP